MYKEKVLKFMRVKDYILFKETGYHIFDEELFDKDFSEEDCKCLIERDVIFVFNSTMCPWCFKFHCSKCTFGFRHGQCDEDDEDEVSLYQNILRSLDNGDFITFPEIKDAWEEMKK